jgi:hypothetical protein
MWHSSRVYKSHPPFFPLPGCHCTVQQPFFSVSYSRPNPPTDMGCFLLPRVTVNAPLEERERRKIASPIHFEILVLALWTWSNRFFVGRRRRHLRLAAFCFEDANIRVKGTGLALPFAMQRFGCACSDDRSNDRIKRRIDIHAVLGRSLKEEAPACPGECQAFSCGHLSR